MNGARDSKAGSDWLVLAALVVAWGSAFAALKIAVHDFPPAWNTVARLWVATATMLIVALARGERPPRFSLAKDSPWRAYAWVGSVGLAIPFVMFAFAATRLPSAVNAICNGASPLFTAALAQLLLADERLGWRKFAGVGLGFVGLVVLVAPRLASGGSLEALALASAIFGAFLYAVSNIITRKAPPVSALSGALMMCSVGAVLATIWAVATTPLPPMPSAEAWAAVTALGVFSSALGSVGYVYLVQRRGPVFMSMSIYLAPLWATALGVAVLGERPGWPAYLALALILAGVGLTTTPAFRR
ncbi:drug/metabolite transporter (DMT)-like permease [Caulobacter ginsengisoli]|uniref:Drug/metabolite transporter (DMT)-like permease n=1 Tax=Caulobacter ginsengisoli TaxID=400775 RepID=A0ABU0IVD5_9CAUL|nr:EamA family transporter [Caulobacter ginsengisoli]MDQ0465088.1 drug/metabolite transporter (DMT)-like permease [Caulobacter ginsengisoli]